MQKRQTSRGLGLLVSLFLLVAVAVGLWQWQAIFDWWRLRDYQPPAAIAELASSTTMTPEAERLFYVFHPQLDDKSIFNEHCTNREQTIVLGCYVTNQGIYLYDVQDPRLQGVKQVTAAHEMLHVAYQRLSRGERERVNGLLQEAYAQVTDERIRANIQAYQDEGADVDNELHSILGTEVANLSPALEEYYRQYFTDRAKVVAIATAYEQEFSARQKRVAQYDSEMAGLLAQIRSNEETLKQQEANLQNQRQRLDSFLASENYGAYNAGVPTYNNAIQEYNRLAQTTRGQIETYNNLVNERNRTSLEHHDLIESLDSRPETQQTR